MARIVLTVLADADSAEIIDYLATRAGRATAIKFNMLFGQFYDQLERHPESGAPRPELRRGVRIGVVAPYIVIYLYTMASDVVTVLRVVDGRRRVSGVRLPPFGESSTD